MSCRVWTIIKNYPHVAWILTCDKSDNPIGGKFSIISSNMFLEQFTRGTIKAICSFSLWLYVDLKSVVKFHPGHKAIIIPSVSFNICHRSAGCVFQPLVHPTFCVQLQKSRWKIQGERRFDRGIHTTFNNRHMCYKSTRSMWGKDDAGLTHRR